jgi:protein-tyrosine phosphatase
VKPPIAGSYWVDEGRLLAGEYPGERDPEAARAKLQRIRAAGVDFFVDLTEDGERAYDGSTLQAYASEIAPLEYRRMSIRDLECPSRAEMRAILDAIDAALDADRCAYVHCWGGLGRTGTVVGCWLVRHGADPDEALASIEERRRGTPDRRRRSPETPEQRAFVRGWSRGA